MQTIRNSDFNYALRAHWSQSFSVSAILLLIMYQEAKKPMMWYRENDRKVQSLWLETHICDLIKNITHIRLQSNTQLILLTA